MTVDRLAVQPRFWLILLALFILVFSLLFNIINERCDELKQKNAELLQECAMLDNEVSELEAQLDYIKSPAGLERYARANGMIKEGETKFMPVERGY